MHFKQFYLGCLAHASYLVGSEGEAAVVDPQRDVEQYLEEARLHGLAIRYVLETHLHADFVSGHRELAERTGAEIVFGARAGVAFPHRAVRDGDEIRMGSVTLRFLETPGHTPESLSILVTEAKDSGPRMVLTGDTLFIGDVGRPDLAGARGFSPEDMAGMLYDSLHGKLLALDDAVLVYPAHGAGSLCGRNISKETSSTIGEQRRFNYALQPMPKADFVRLVTADLPDAPEYFPRDVELNRAGAPTLGAEAPPRPLPPAEVEALAAKGAVLLDVRGAAAYGAGHLPGSLNVALQGQFASWSGILLPPERAIVIVADDETAAAEAKLRLARVGLESVAGHLAGGVAAWAAAARPVATLAQVTVDELHARLGEGEGLDVLDVRRPAEQKLGHVPGARLLPLDRLGREAAGLDPARPLAVICAGGYRSSAACSLLEGHGFRRLYNVVGGTAAWAQAGLPLARPAGEGGPSPSGSASAPDTGAR
jgi:glyoxylase-like metal-dependent hydrolase (beta-lactamase superfamily II)/rhodanese-related sulfurtransferase